MSGSSHNNPYNVITPMQAGMLLVGGDSSSRTGMYVAQLVVAFEEELDVELFTQSFHYLAGRHAVLRTRLRFDSELGWSQYIEDEASMPVSYFDWSDRCRQEQAFEDFLRNDRERGFDLASDSPSRISLFRLGARDFRMIWTTHHVQLDGRSRLILLKELFAIYDAALKSEFADLGEPGDYRDYLAWLNAYDATQSKGFWQQHLDDAENTAMDFKGRTRPRMFADQTRAITVQAQLSDKMTSALYDMSERFGLTLNTVSLGAWALLVGAYTGDDDVVLGVVRSTRHSLPRRLHSVAGMVINTIPFRLPVYTPQKTSDWLRQVRELWVEMRAYELTPVRSIRQWLDWPLDKPVFTSIHSHEHRPVYEQRLTGSSATSVRRFRLIPGRTEAPVSVQTYGGRQWLAQIYADEAIFTSSEAELMGERYKAILEGMIQHPDRSVDAIERLTPYERKQFSARRCERLSAPPYSVVEAFETQALMDPQHPALVAADTSLNYGQLQEASKRLSGTLRNLEQHRPVGLLMGSEPGFVVALFATLMSGEGCVSLDPEYPVERIRYMLKDCGVQVVITNAVHRSLAVETLTGTGHAGFVLVLDDPALSGCAKVHQLEGDAITVGSDSIEDLLYVVYTSGSTGRPKGVPVTNANLMPLMRWQKEPFRLCTETRTAQTLSLSFDFGLQEVFTTLLYGGTLYFPSAGTLQDPARYVEFLHAHQVNMVYATPSYMDSVLSVHSRLDTLRVVLLGGERLNWDLVDRLHAQLNDDCVVFNGYGPTEATINCAMYRIDVNDAEARRHGASVPIGQPTGGSRLHVLDRHRRPVPIGVPGELYIGGPGVVSGYLGPTDLTKSSFILDTSVDPDRLYQTGDLVVNRPDECLEFLGRLDHQVKVRGYRIELGEIESVLAAHPDVASVAATVDQQDNPGRITAYVVPVHDTLDAGQLRTYLRKHLPMFMAPAVIRFLPALPLTANGKIDREALCTSSHAAASAPSDSADESRQRAPYANWFYQPVWRPAPIDLDANQRRVAAVQGPWLIVGEESELTRVLFRYLRRFQAKVYQAIPSQTDARIDSATCAVDFSRAEGLSLLLTDLAAKKRTPSKVIYICNARESSSPGLAVDDTCVHLLHLLQALGKHYRARDLDLGVVTANVHGVTGGDALNPRHALVPGLCKSLPYEHPRLRWAHIDIDRSAPTSDGLAGKIIDDLKEPECGTSIAYRRGTRYVLNFETLPMPERETHCPVRPDGAYLLTGGLGAIALELAEHLVHRGASKLALLDTDSALAGKNQGTEARLSNLADRGAEVLLVAADVCDRSQVSSALGRVRRRFGEIAGVLHTAGVVEAQLLSQLAPDTMTRVFNPKVLGAEVLASELERDKPDFVLLFSSIDALRGNFGQAAYCAANAFLDAYAHTLHQRGLPFYSVNWDVWRDVGMAARVRASPAVSELRQRELSLGLNPSEGRRVFDTVLNRLRPQQIVSTTELESRIGRFYLSSFNTPADLAEPDTSQAETTESTVLGVFASVLEDDTVTEEDDFFLRGGDSLSAMRVVARLKSLLNVELPMSSLFEAPTVASLAQLAREAAAQAEK